MAQDPMSLSVAIVAQAHELLPSGQRLWIHFWVCLHLSCAKRVRVLLDDLDVVLNSLHQQHVAQLCLFKLAHGE